MTGHTDVAPSYRAFPDLEWRNALQSSLEVPVLVRLLRLSPGGRILEVGCGRGIGLEALGRLLKPALLTGIDVDEGLLSKAESALGKGSFPARLFRADVRDLPFEDGSFDTVFDFGTCHHVSRPAAALREVARVLRPGGLFVHESGLAQLLAHPTRSSGRALPWEAVPDLVPYRTALLWSARRKVAREV
jgi:ubiquinone/menaquinone biosynthesis C-methylase UbiE